PIGIAGGMTLGNSPQQAEVEAGGATFRPAAISVDKNICRCSAFQLIDRDEAEPVDHEPYHGISRQAVHVDATLLDEPLQRAEKVVGVQGRALNGEAGSPQLQRATGTPPSAISAARWS